MHRIASLTHRLTKKKSICNHFVHATKTGGSVLISLGDGGGGNRERSGGDILFQIFPIKTVCGQSLLIPANPKKAEPSHGLPTNASKTDRLK
jgi:hypothetical protein